MQARELVLVNSFDEKAEVIAEKGIGIYFDDQPEMLKDIPRGGRDVGAKRGQLRLRRKEVAAQQEHRQDRLAEQGRRFPLK